MELQRFHNSLVPTNTVCVRSWRANEMTTKTIEQDGLEHKWVTFSCDNFWGKMLREQENDGAGTFRVSPSSVCGGYLGLGCFVFHTTLSLSLSGLCNSLYVLLTSKCAGKQKYTIDFQWPCSETPWSQHKGLLMTLPPSKPWVGVILPWSRRSTAKPLMLLIILGQIYLSSEVPKFNKSQLI